MTKQRAAGFGSIKVLVVIIITAIVGGLIAIGYTSFMKKSAISQDARVDLKAAQSTTQAFYASYTNSQGKGAAILAQYGTEKLLAASKTGKRSFSPIVCAQNVAPVSTSTPHYVDGHYDVPVTLNFSPPLTFIVQVVKVGNSFKIDQVNCPASTGHGE